MRKDCINRELTLEWIVGTFMFLILLALGYFTIIIGSDNLLRRTYEFEALFQDVAGLRKGDNVTIQGMAVGKVTEIELHEAGVSVRCALDRPLALRQGYLIEVVSTSVLGGRQLRIVNGPPANPLLPDDTVFSGATPLDMMAEAAQVVHEVRVALTDGGILEQITEGVASLNRVAGRLARGEGTLGALLADDAPYQDLVAIMGDVRRVAGQAYDLLAAVERGEGTVGKLFKDSAIGDHLAAVMADVRAITARLHGGQGTLGRLLSADDALYEDLAQTMASLRAVTAQVEKGEGSLGKLIADDALYQQAKALVDEIRATVDDFREASPLTTFTSILFGAL